MEQQKNSTKGIQIFSDFVKSVPEGLTDFDYFHLLDHLSQNKLDKDLLAAIFCERNKPFEEEEKK